MTVTNHAAAKEFNLSPVSTVFIINVILSLIAGLLVIYYVVQANIIAADSYKINLLNEKLDSLNEVHSSLVAQKSSIEDPARILDFALGQNMVEAKNATYIFENGNVALRQ